MSKLTWKDLERKDIAIHTPSKELMVKVANVIADKYGDITQEQNVINSRENGDVCPDAYYVYEKDTYVDLTHNKWHFADKECFLYDNYEIVEYEEVKHLFEDYKGIMSKRLDMDGNELKVGDRVLFATTNKTIARGIITEIDGDIGLAYIHTLKNRHTNIRCECLLLDTTIRSCLNNER